MEVHGQQNKKESRCIDLYRPPLFCLFVFFFYKTKPQFVKRSSEFK